MLNLSPEKKELDQICVLYKRLWIVSKYYLVYFGLVICSLLNFLHFGEIALQHLKNHNNRALGIYPEDSWELLF